MTGLSIGEVARRTGLAASTLRFYEKAGLLPSPLRLSNQRRYDAAILGRIKLVKIARSAGFTVEETRKFISGFPAGTAPSARWQALAERKRQELDALIDGAQRMKAVLATQFGCRCPRLEDCESAFAERRC
jgi:MerR family transcriptional regulator, redox-sensitive transcriptional activator SoxR